MTRQQLPYFVGISGETVNASGQSMHQAMPITLRIGNPFVTPAHARAAFR